MVYIVVQNGYVNIDAIAKPILIFMIKSKDHE